MTAEEKMQTSDAATRASQTEVTTLTSALHKQQAQSKVLSDRCATLTAELESVSLDLLDTRAQLSSKVKSLADVENDASARESQAYGEQATLRKEVDRLSRELKLARDAVEVQRAEFERSMLESGQRQGKETQEYREQLDAFRQECERFKADLVEEQTRNEALKVEVEEVSAENSRLNGLLVDARRLHREAESRADAEVCHPL